MQEFEIEMERLCSRMEHLKSQNEVLALSLGESRAHSDHLTVLLGKYESNLVALNLVNSYADHLIKCHEALRAIQAGEAGLSAGVLAGTGAAEEAETRRVLAKIEAVVRPDSGKAHVFKFTLSDEVLNFTAVHFFSGLAMISSSSNESPSSHLWDRASSEQSELTG